MKHLVVVGFMSFVCVKGAEARTGHDSHPGAVTLYTLTANAGKDTTLPFAQMDSVTRLTLKGAASGGTISAWQWTKLSGGSVSIATPGAQNTLVSGFQPGTYTFQLTVTSGSTTATDVIVVKVVDYQKKGEAPCRSGAPKTWTLATTANSTIFYPYLRRDGYAIQGGDTVKIPGGTYTGISLGDFGGSDGCPVVVVPTGTVTVTGSGPYFRIGSGIGDSNFVSHVNVMGTYLRSKGVAYGFQVINAAPNASTVGFTENLATDIEASGIYIQNAGLGVFAKLTSDSSRPYRLFNNFYMKNLKFHDFYIRRTTSEAMYLGHTSPQGEQSDNQGATVRLDSVEVYNNLIDSSGWDGIQVSNAIYASIHDNIVYRAAVTNMGSQRAWIIMGGNTCGKIYNNVGYNLKEGMRGTPYGNVEIYNNYGDSINCAYANDDGIYMTGIPTGPGTDVVEKRPLFKPNAHDNIFARTVRFAINFPNSYGFNTAGVITGNKFVDATKTAAQLVGTALDVVSNNTVYKTFPVTIRNVSTNLTGMKISVQQNDSTRVFTDAASIIDWLRCRLTGCVVTPVVTSSLVANAGADTAIYLPLSSHWLDAVKSTDGTGSIVSYKWTKVSGPTSCNILTDTARRTLVNKLVAGAYVFQVTVTDSKGAISTDQKTLTVYAAKTTSAVVSTASVSADTFNADSVTLSSMQVYPNPAHDQLTLRWPRAVSVNLPVSILDVQGAVKYSTVVQGSDLQHVFSVQGLSPGVYFIRVQYGGRPVTLKFIVI